MNTVKSYLLIGPSGLLYVLSHLLAVQVAVLVSVFMGGVEKH
jgi:hypothetical protein